MNLAPTDVSKQIEQMITFMRQEAEERAQEIIAKAEEEFNVEKGRLICEERAKLTKFYDKKEKHIELQRKIQQSHIVSARRMSILQAREDCVQQLKEEAKKMLMLAVEDRAKYILVLLNLITQGLLILMELRVLVRCRYEDYGLVQRLVPKAVRRCEEELGLADMQVTVDNENFLSDDVNGGVELLAMDGKIRLLNTLEARLEMIFAQMLPEIRQTLFGGNATR